MHYEALGDGQPILMIHGLGCDSRLMLHCMEPVFAAWPKVNGAAEAEGAQGSARAFQRIYVDLPGMGESRAPLNFARPERMLEVLEAFVEARVKGPFLLAGESFGGYLARGLLLKFRPRVDGLMLLCPMVSVWRRHLPETYVRFHDKGFLKGLSAEERRHFRAHTVIANEETYRRYLADIEVGVRDSDHRFIRSMGHAYEFPFDVDAALAREPFDKPGLFLCGRQDDRVGYQDIWDLIRYYPRASYSVLDAAGHQLQLEQPELFQALVKNWLLRVAEYAEGELVHGAIVPDEELKQESCGEERATEQHDVKGRGGA